MPSWLDDVEVGSLVAPDTTFEELSAALGEAYRLPPVRDVRRRDLSVEEVRAYVRGRTALAADRPSEALRWLRAVSETNSPEVRVGIADALGRMGRRTEMVSVLWSLSVEDELPASWEPVLVEGLVQQRRFADAIAVLVRSIGRTEDGIARIAGWIAVADLLSDLDRSALAAGIRRTLLEQADFPWSSFESFSPGVLARFLRRSGDDAVRLGDIDLAQARWASAHGILPSDPSIRRRLIWSSACLGLDSEVASLLLQASVFPSDIDLQGGAWARKSGVDLDSLKRELRGRLLSESSVLGTAQMLVAVDPENASRDLRLLADRRPELDLAEAIVAASLPGGPRSAIETAGAVVKDPRTLDAIVDLIVGGPWSTEPLLLAAVESSDMLDTPIVAAEILRRFGRLDLAGDRLDRPTSTERGSVLDRLARLRLYADAGDPVLVSAVSSVPFDVEVETERVRALVACGEPEIAFSVATGLVEARPEDPLVLMERARAAELLVGSEVVAFEDALKACELGDSPEAAILLIDLVARNGSDLEGVAPRIRRMLAQFELDEKLRRLITADRAWRRGDMPAVISELETLLASPSMREQVLVRLLPAWRGLGRLEDALRMLRRMQQRRPADPVLSDAIFAIERTLRDPREMAIELRSEVDGPLDGLPSRRLEILLADIPESRPELTRRRRIELSRRPKGPARRIEELLLDLDVGEQVVVEDFDLDLEALPERLRRRGIAAVGLLPQPDGMPLVERILEFHRLRGLPIDVDTAAVALSVLGPERGLAALGGLRPLGARTRLDSTWTDRIASLTWSDPGIAAGLARFAVSGLTPEDAEPSLLRLAIAAEILAGDSVDLLVETLEGSLALGWSPAESWGMEDEDEVLALRGVSSDATMLGDRRVACLLLRRLVEMRPESGLAFNNLGFGLLMIGDLEGAGAALARAYELDPNNPSTLDSLGWLRYAEGRHDPEDPEGALALIRRSIDLRIRGGITPSPEVMLHLGDASWKAGLRNNAVSAWRTVVDLGARRDPRERARILDQFQESIWGAVLVPSKTLDYHLDGQWIEAAEDRLEAWEADESPPVTEFTETPDA